eukprot:jgi/Bigna1/137389/aug1.39_g12097
MAAFDAFDAESSPELRPMQPALTPPAMSPRRLCDANRDTKKRRAMRIFVDHKWKNAAERLRAGNGRMVSCRSYGDFLHVERGGYAKYLDGTGGKASVITSTSHGRSVSPLPYGRRRRRRRDRTNGNSSRPSSQNGLRVLPRVASSQQFNRDHTQSSHNKKSLTPHVMVGKRRRTKKRPMLLESLVAGAVNGFNWGGATKNHDQCSLLSSSSKPEVSNGKGVKKKKSLIIIRDLFGQVSSARAKARAAEIREAKARREADS